MARRSNPPKVVDLTFEKRGTAALAGAIGLVYAPALLSPVIYDDAGHVRDNPVFNVPVGEFWSGLVSRNYFSFAVERTYQPVVTLFHYVFHSNPLLYRSIGLGLHLLNAVLLYRVAQRLTAGRRPAIYAACLFAAFPASTELLNFSAFKGHLFAASFSLAVVLGVMELCSDREGKKPLLPFAVCCFLVLALLSKETGLTAVALSFLYVGLFVRKEIGRLKGIGATLLAISAVYLWWRFFYLIPPRTFPVRFEYSTLESLSFYLRTLAVPYPLCLERSLPAGSSWVLWLAGFSAAVWFLRKSKESLFASAWIAACLLPFLHLISFSNVSPVADRYLYLPAAGLSLLLANVFSGREAVLASILVIWTGLTASRNWTYRSTRALYEQTASCAPQNPRAQFLLGMITFQEKDYPASRAAYTRVLALTESPGAREALLDIDRAEKAAASPTPASAP